MWLKVCNPLSTHLNIPKDCKPKKKKNADFFNDKYIKCKCEGDERLTMEKYLQQIRPYLHDMMS